MRIEQLATAAGLDGPRRYVVDWQRVEAALGTRLPADYKEYVYWFGPGNYDDYLSVCIPGVENSGVELEARLAAEREIQQQRAEINRRYRPPFPLFPAPGGWLPFAFTSNGDVLYWVTAGEDPERWTVAGRPGRGDDVGYFAGGFADFMREFVWDTIELHFIAETESAVPIVFEPGTGAWRGGGATRRLEPYGCFEEPPED